MRAHSSSPARALQDGPEFAAGTGRASAAPAQGALALLVVSVALQSPSAPASAVVAAGVASLPIAAAASSALPRIALAASSDHSSRTR